MHRRRREGRLRCSPEEGGERVPLLCPVCQVLTVVLIRGKRQCRNCGYVDSCSLRAGPVGTTGKGQMWQP